LESAFFGALTQVGALFVFTEKNKQKKENNNEEALIAKKQELHKIL
jgi:hypothetical protein